MPTLLRVIAMGLVVLATIFVLAGLTDDAPGLIPIAALLVGVAIYAFLGSKREDARANRIEDLLRRLVDR